MAITCSAVAAPVLGGPGERDGQEVAEISKRWFRVRDTYGIEVGPGENDALILAAAVCIDEVVSD